MRNPGKKPILKHPGRRLPIFEAQLHKNIADELKLRPQWVMYREQSVGRKKPTKVPYAISDGVPRCSVTNPSTWGTFEGAVGRLRNGSYTGIGYVFTSGDPYCGIDLDNCRDPKTGEIEPQAAAFVDTVNSYTEISPSGKGVHIIAKANLTNLIGRRKNSVEMYDQGRYFTMNGCTLPGRNKIRDAQQDIERLHAEIFGYGTAAPSDHGNSAEAQTAPPIDDDDIVQQMTEGGSESKAAKLWAGDWTALYESQSEADLALCGMVARSTRDPAQVDRLFRRSGLMRDKWDENRGVETYGTMTIKKTLAGASDIDRGELLKRLNNEFAVVGVGDKIRILQHLESSKPNDPSFRLLTAADFAMLLRNRHAPT